MRALTRRPRATSTAANRPPAPTRSRAHARLTRRGRLACAAAVLCAALGVVGGAHLAVGLGLAVLAACALARAEARSLARRRLVRAGWPPPPAVRDARVILRYAAAPAPPSRRRPGLTPGPSPGLPRGAVDRGGRLRGAVIRDVLHDGERRLPMLVRSLAARTPPLPRGVWRPGAVQLEFRDRLGLAVAVTPAADDPAAPAPPALVVRPAVVARMPWLAQAARAPGPRRHTAERLPEVRAVRLYSPGDELRLLDWRTTLRTGLPHVRELAADAPAGCAVLLDTGVPVSAPDRGTATPQHTRTFEAAVDCAASLAVHALRLGLAVSLATGAVTRQVAASAGAEAAVLDALAAVRPRPGQDPAGLTRAATAPLSGALAVLVTNRSPDLWRPALDALSGRYDTVLCVCVGPGGAARSPARLRAAHLVQVTGAADLERLTPGTLTAVTR